MEKKVLEASKQFWNAMEASNEEGMRAVADPNCQFVHIGVTCGLDQEINYYTSGIFQPTGVTFHNQDVRMYGDSTAVVISDVDYALLLDGKETSHHFAVTEVFSRKDDEWKLVQFSFTALVY